jgi:hypothetical protein
MHKLCPHLGHLLCHLGLLVENVFHCLRTSLEAILEPLGVHFLFVAPNSISGKASKLQLTRNEIISCWRRLGDPWF